MAPMIKQAEADGEPPDGSDGLPPWLRPHIFEGRPDVEALLSESGESAAAAWEDSVSPEDRGLIIGSGGATNGSTGSWHQQLLAERRKVGLHARALARD